MKTPVFTNDIFKTSDSFYARIIMYVLYVSIMVWCTGLNVNLLNLKGLLCYYIRLLAVKRLPFIYFTFSSLIIFIRFFRTGDTLPRYIVFLKSILKYA